MRHSAAKVLRRLTGVYNANELFPFLSVHAGKVLTYAAIIRSVWGYSDYGSVKKLQVNMKNIRKKMGVTPGEKRYIINELGVGYRMLAEDETVADSFL